MNFSDFFSQSAGLCHFSPDGEYLANAVQFRLIIRDVKTLQIVHVFTCLDTIQLINWSPDSQFLVCGLFKRGLVQAWSMEQPEWTCKIDEGFAGLVDVRWCPDSRHILTTADFHLRITVWSLVSKSVSYIKYPKPCSKGLDFTSNGKYLALAEHRDCKDYVSVFDCTSWQLVRNFETDTDDLAGLNWSPTAESSASGNHPCNTRCCSTL
jgi:WD40 repeat protein